MILKLTMKLLILLRCPPSQSHSQSTGFHKTEKPVFSQASGYYQLRHWSFRSNDDGDDNDDDYDDGNTLQVLRSAWMSLRDRVSAMDEVTMSKLRFRLKLEGEEVPEGVKHIFRQDEIEPLYQQQVCHTFNFIILSSSFHLPNILGFRSSSG